MSRPRTDDDLDRVTRLLETLEAEHHAAGWDNTPATLYRCGPDPTGEWCVGSVELDDNPRLQLEAWAVVAADPGRVAVIETGFDRPPVAHLLISEGWARQSDENDFSDTRRFADRLGSVEIRCGMAIAGERVAGVYRTRGQKPTSDYRPEGAVFNSLRDFHQAIARYWVQRRLSAVFVK